MTTAERRRCMFLLKLAKQGESEAKEQLAIRIADHFAYMVRSYRSADPAYDMDDIYHHFQLGIWQAIPKIDHRGDPLFHLAWRGQRAVTSLLRVWRNRRQGTSGERSIGCIPEGFDIPDPSLETQLDHNVLLESDKQETRQQVRYILGHAELTDRQWDVVAWMMTDNDARAKGANLRLANRMGISPQMASKHREAVVTILSGNSSSTQSFTCLRCGRDFRSKGALTQHRNGQSGHKPCTNIAQLAER